MPPAETTSTPDARVTAWFSAMLLAAHRGNYQEAAAAQHQLKELGWRVERIKTPRQAARPEGVNRA
jgi:hypothetical protein